MITAGNIELLARDAVRNHSMGCARAQQQQEHRIGASEIGVCRNYLRHMTIGTEYDDGAEDDKFAAFVGTAIGDRLESAWQGEYPESVTQAEFTVTLPSGLQIPCHADVIDRERNFVLDWKAKDGLALLRGERPDRSHEFQIALYRLGAIQAGLLGEDAQAFVVYVDRSAADKHPFYAVEVACDVSLYLEIDEWIADSNYAVLHGEEAPRDRPYPWCQVACPFFTKCRGQETLTEGVLEDPEVSLAAKKYLEANQAININDRIKKEALEVLKGKEGFIPDLGRHLSWTTVGESTVNYTRASYQRINLRKPGGKGKDVPES